jgi:hypothetical protein
MTIIFIVVAIIIFVIYMYKSDKREVVIKNLQRGGLTTRFQNFIAYCAESNVAGTSDMQFVKDDGEYLEYRGALPVNNSTGHFHIGIRSNFGTYLYVHAISPRGKKINGFLHEVKDNRDLSIFEYEFIYSDLINQMENVNDFAKKFMDE